jgi:hypothetical protein
MKRTAAFLTIILIAGPLSAGAEPPNPLETPSRIDVAPTAAPKAAPVLKVAPDVQLGKLKPVACQGAQSTTFFLSSCGGAPGTALTLTSTNTVVPLAVVFKQNVPGSGSFSTQVRRSAGTYSLAVPPLCNGGNPSFNLALIFERGSTRFSQGLGTFSAVCPATAQPTAAPQPASGTMCPPADAYWGLLLSACSGVPGASITAAGQAVGLFEGRFGYILASTNPSPFPLAGSTNSFIVPSVCGLGDRVSISLTVTYLPGPLGNVQTLTNLGTFSVLCPAAKATASPKAKR